MFRLQIGNGDMICHSCWVMALNINREFSNEQPSTSGHRRILCVNCGCSLARTRWHTLCTDTERDARIRNTIINWILPRQVSIL